MQKKKRKEQTVAGYQASFICAVGRRIWEGKCCDRKEAFYILNILWYEYLENNIVDEYPMGHFVD